MPADVGTQTVTIKWLTEAASRKVNERFYLTRPTGIYTGGYLLSVDKNNVTVSPLICEISDVDTGFQVRVKTAATVTITEAGAGNELDTKYIVLRWDYTGSATVDYMALLAVDEVDIRADDLIVGYCTWGGSAYSFDYARSGFLRATPDSHSTFLNVEAPDVTMADKMKVRVRAGKVHSNSALITVADQQTPSAFTHSGGVSTEYGLVYIDTAGIVQIVDADGNTSIPAYAGKMVLAIVTVAPATSTILQSMITDVRNWISPVAYPDDLTIQRDSDGKFSTKNTYMVLYAAGNQIGSQADWTKVAMSEKNSSGITETSSVVTLSANVLYDIHYNVGFEQISGSPRVQTRIAVQSGDSTWDLENVTLKEIEMGTGPELETGPLAGSYLFKPSSDTTIQLEARTFLNSNQTARVTMATLSIASR